VAATWFCLFGGLFLLYKASHEIFVEVEAREARPRPPDTDPAAHQGRRRPPVLGHHYGQIAVIDIVFSLDSVITAVGMVDQIGVMVAAVITSVGVMLFAAKPIGDFVDKPTHPSRCWPWPSS
jgi:predicted tellurium resistance membrane protein TerC